MSRPEWENYNDEYLISLNNDGIWCEQMKSNDKYLTDESMITYILDNCSSKVIPYCKGETVYEVAIGEEETEREENYSINREASTKEEFDAYTSQFKKTEDETNDNSTYHITIKGDLDIGDAEKIIEDMERRMIHMQDIFDEMNHFRRLFGW